MSLILIDLEATCWPPGDPRRKQQSEISEIIEVYCAAVAPHRFSVISEFHTYVRPSKNPRLTSFCTELTGLSQEVIDQAPSSKQFIEAWQSWLGDRSFTLASWGSFDHRLLSRVWKENKHSTPPWVHLDIQSQFELCCRAHRAEQSKWYQNSKLSRISGLSLKEGLSTLEIEWQGQAHTAKTDTLAALDCLRFACSPQGFTPLEKSFMSLVKREEQQGRATYWGESVRALGIDKANFQFISRSLVKRGFLCLESNVGALRLHHLT